MQSQESKFYVIDTLISRYYVRKPGFKGNLAALRIDGDSLKLIQEPLKHLLYAQEIPLPPLDFN